MKATAILVCAWATLGAFPFADAREPRKILADAVAVWHLADERDAVGLDSRMQIRDRVTLGVALSGPDREASLARGGDGQVAQFDGGWLDAGQGHSGELNLAGDQFTALLRLRCLAANAWTTRGCFTKGGGHDRLVFNFFAHDFGQGQPGMRVGCEIGVEGQKGLGGQVTAPLAQIGPTSWHDLVARYDGSELALFVDGVPLQRVPAAGRLRQGNAEPLALGAGGPGDAPFSSLLVDHAALWQRALHDEEIVTLSGGLESQQAQQAAFAKFMPPPPETSTSTLVEHARELTRKFQLDAHRPRYHLLHPEEGVIMPGDPNGGIEWKGRYHLFYIFQRRQASEPRVVHCWGHVSSADLVHWEHHPVALDVAANDPDRGIFSGNAFVSKAGVPTLLYHGVAAGNCIASAADDLLVAWKKSSANPIVPLPKPGEPDYGRYDSWDPHGWLEGDTYYAIFGSNPHTGAQAALFKGSELTQLKFVAPFLARDAWSQPGEDISCPDFFPLGDKHVLLCISHLRGARYFIGSWEGERFLPEHHARMNWPGGQFFAPESFQDHRDRRILFAWCLDERPDAVKVASGWSGAMSLPRVLAVGRDGLLTIEPAEELERLRFNLRTLPPRTLAADREVMLEEIRGDSFELNIVMAARGAREFGLRLRQAPDRAEETTILYDAATGRLAIDLSKSTLDPAIRYRTWCITPPADAADRDRRVTRQEAPLTLAAEEPLRLRIFLDRSMLEVFANGRQCLTQRLWPTRPDALGVSLFSSGGETHIESLAAWDMAATHLR